MAARIPAHRRKRDPYGRAILAPRIPPPAPVPVAVLTEAEEDWPSPVVAPADDDREQPAAPVPTVEPDPLVDVYHHILEPCTAGGWLALYCLRCGAAWQGCGGVLAPDRRWTTTGPVLDFARL